MIVLGRVIDGVASGAFYAHERGPDGGYTGHLAFGRMHADRVAQNDATACILAGHRHLGIDLTRFAGEWPMIRVYGRLFGRSFDRWFGGNA